MASEQATQNLVDLISKRIETLGADTIEARSGIYRSLRSQLDRRIAEGKVSRNALGSLDDAIERVERNYPFDELTDPAPIRNGNSSDLNSNVAPRRASATDLASDGGVRSGGISRWLIAAALVVAVVGGGYYFLRPVNQDGLNIAALGEMSTDPGGKVAAETAAGFGRSEDAATIITTGPIELYSMPAVPVDVTQTYELQVRLRVLPGADNSSREARVYAGIATYDAAGKLETSEPGTHRYALLNNAHISSDQGWIERKVIVEGAGDGRADQFRTGSAAMKLVVIANYGGSPSTQVEISSLSWRLVPKS